MTANVMKYNGRAEQSAKRVTMKPSEEEWQLAQKAFLRLEDRRRKTEATWRKAALKQIGTAFSSIELGWAAGFWDGEGHVSARERNGEFDCSLDQADRVLLERLQSALGGIGRISPIKRRLSAKGKMQFIYTFKITNQRDLQKAWLAIGLPLGPQKRDQFARALSVPLATLMRKDKMLPEGTKSATATGRRHPLGR